MAKHKPKKHELEYYAGAKPHTKESPGYFTDAGEFVRGPFWHAKLGIKNVGFHGIPGYDRASGGYKWRDAALEGAKAFQEKSRELLELGEYDDS
jgi:hypothetical protein